MRARALLWCLCAAAGCRGTATVTADDLIVTASVKPTTISLSSDTAPIFLTITARNPESHPIDVDTHGAVRVPISGYAAIIGDSAADPGTMGVTFGHRVVRSGRTFVFGGKGAGQWTVHFGAGESKVDAWKLRHAEFLQFVRGGGPGVYLLIGSYARHEARPLRLVVTP